MMRSISRSPRRPWHVPAWVSPLQPAAPQKKDTRHGSATGGENSLENACATCGGPLESGFVTTTNGSGLFWSKDSSESRVRPIGLEVLVPTRFHGTYSANAQGLRCRNCGTILVRTSDKAL
ncbi:MAG: PF20097 family protein [Thermoplasmata archaeon]|nr:PF20097 family protein [Thermoplasmata archaeon]